MCNNNQYESRAAMATSDRTCAALLVCSASQYQCVAATATANSVCCAILVCTGETYESKAPTATANCVCTPLSVCLNAKEHCTEVKTCQWYNTYDSDVYMGQVRPALLCCSRLRCPALTCSVLLPRNVAAMEGGRPA